VRFIEEKSYGCPARPRCRIATKNAKLHSILSLGLHESDEAKCLKFFPVLRQSTIWILEQDKKSRKSLRKRRSLSRRLSPSSQKHHRQRLPRNFHHIPVSLTIIPRTPSRCLGSDALLCGPASECRQSLLGLTDIQKSALQNYCTDSAYRLYTNYI
jgi:hypothetical protein